MPFGRKGHHFTAGIALVRLNYSVSNSIGVSTAYPDSYLAGSSFGHINIRFDNLVGNGGLNSLF
jgi:hypothetical protein